MIILEHDEGLLPVVRVFTPSQGLAYAAAIAFRDGKPRPHNIDLALEVLTDPARRRWAFYADYEAEAWAADYDGPDAEQLRFAVFFHISEVMPEWAKIA